MGSEFLNFISSWIKKAEGEGSFGLPDRNLLGALEIKLCFNGQTLQH